MDIKRQLLERAKARLEARLAAERRIAESLPEEERAVYALVVLRQTIVKVLARAKNGEPAETAFASAERAEHIQAILAATARAIAIRDALARENRLEAVLASLRHRGLITQQMSVESLRLDNLAS